MRTGFLALILGLLSAVGPFAIDMYLPALPAISQALKTDAQGVQASLSVFFISFALSQLVFGPASDMVGRKPPLYVGLALFIVGSIGCALAPDIETLLMFRVLQGIGGGAPMVIPRAIVRDHVTGVEATRLMSLLLLVFSVSPVLAPLAGSLVIELAGWRAIFWCVTGVGVVGVLMVMVLLPETRLPAARQGSDWRGLLRAFGVLLRDARFMGLVGIGGFGMGGFFVYLANSSFVLIEGYRLTTGQYGMAFGANAIAFIVASQASARLVARFGLPRLIRLAAAGYALVMTALAVAFVAGAEALPLMVGGLMAGYGCLGLVVPTSSVLALDEHGEIAGAASALLGTLQLVLGAAVIAAVGPFAQGGAVPMLAGIAIASLLTAALAHWTLARRGPVDTVLAGRG